jgi:hypothetical protein
VELSLHSVVARTDRHTGWCWAGAKILGRPFDRKAMNRAEGTSGDDTASIPARFHRKSATRIEVCAWAACGAQDLGDHDCNRVDSRRCKTVSPSFHALLL